VDFILSSAGVRAWMVRAGRQSVAMVTAGSVGRGTFDVAVLVSPRNRHRGLGTLALRLMERRLRGLQGRNMRASIHRSNIPSLRCFAAAGFQQSVAGGPQGFVVLRKRLARAGGSGVHGDRPRR
jgi:GNAT superfamily N-acetyltransferase